MRIVLASCALMVAMLGCGGSPDLETGFEDTLTETGTCALYVYAGAADESVLLVFHVLESPTSIVADGGERTYDFAQSDAGGVLHVELGSQLTSEFCSTEPAGGDVAARYHPVAGSGTLQVSEPQPGTYEVDLTLRDILFHKELADHEVLMPELSLLGLVLEE